MTEQYYAPPPKLSNWEGFKRFLWNGETGQFMGRTAGSWGELHKFFFFTLVVGATRAVIATQLQKKSRRKPNDQRQRHRAKRMRFRDAVFHTKDEDKDVDKGGRGGKKMCLRNISSSSLCVSVNVSVCVSVYVC